MVEKLSKAKQEGVKVILNNLKTFFKTFIKLLCKKY